MSASNIRNATSKGNIYNEGTHYLLYIYVISSDQILRVSAVNVNIACIFRYRKGSCSSNSQYALTIYYSPDLAGMLPVC